VSQVKHTTPLATGQDDGLELLGLGHADDGNRTPISNNTLSAAKIFV